ncbi:hypothetical protein MNV_820009 [Candidatus Methanoperedens nitroreducens]|uniref:Uncharacterized protein n=1 Tax=Candidatus Methanoperedens nitratireducens TaxID=1392998 RepID=A0A284VTS8_9EURY|nr:hypothetical protein MNV_820009 [Candidatus Methanoperedens nitroreducens]
MSSFIITDNLIIKTAFKVFKVQCNEKRPDGYPVLPDVQGRPRA